MQENARRPKKTSQLAESVERHLHMYAAAASAAGVGLLALSQPAEAKVIHKVVNVTIGGPGFQGFTSYSLDLNSDGITDFTITLSFFLSGGSYFNFLRVLPGQTPNEVWAVQCGAILPCAYDVQGNVLIDSGAPFKNGSLAMCSAGLGFGYGAWCPDTTGRFLALKFTDFNGNIHLGWARINALGSTVVLTDYAYETEKNTSIRTWKPAPGDDLQPRPRIRRLPPDAAIQAMPSARPAANLGLLALGNRGLEIWRRESDM